MGSQELYGLQDPAFGKAGLFAIILPFERKRIHSTTKIQSSTSSNANVRIASHPFPFFSFSVSMDILISSTTAALKRKTENLAVI